MSKGAQQPGAAAEPTDPDVDLAVPAAAPRDHARASARSWRWWRSAERSAPAPATGPRSCGPPQPGSFPWTTLLVNGVGCAVIGVFMVVITDVWAAHRLVRPFFGTGVLGGFTTFSTYAVDIQKFVADGQPRTGLAYLALTLLRPSRRCGARCG